MNNCYKVTVRVDDPNIESFECVVSAPREGLAKTEAMHQMFLHWDNAATEKSAPKLRGQMVEYEVEQL